MATNLMNILGMLGGQQDPEVEQKRKWGFQGGFQAPWMQRGVPMAQPGYTPSRGYSVLGGRDYGPSGIGSGPEVVQSEFTASEWPLDALLKIGEAEESALAPIHRKFELEKLKELNERFSEEKALELIKSGDIEASDRFGDAYLKALGEISPETRYAASQDPEAVSRLQEFLTPEQQLAKDREERPWNYEGSTRLPSKDPAWDEQWAIAEDPLSSLGGFLAGGIGGLGKGAVSHVTGKPDPRSLAEAMSEGAIGGMETAQDIAGSFTPPSSEIFPITVGAGEYRDPKIHWGGLLGDVLTLGARPIYKGLTGVGREKPGWTPGTPTPEQKPDRDGPAKDLKKEEGSITEESGDPIIDPEDQAAIDPFDQKITNYAKEHGITKEEAFKRLAQEELGVGSDDLDEFTTDMTQRLTEALDRKPGWPEFLMAFALTLQGQDGVGYLRSKNSEYLNRARVLGNLLGEARSEKSRRDAMGVSQGKTFQTRAEKQVRENFGRTEDIYKSDISRLGKLLTEAKGLHETSSAGMDVPPGMEKRTSYKDIRENLDRASVRLELLRKIANDYGMEFATEKNVALMLEQPSK